MGELYASNHSRILVYTRKVVAGEYPEGLAHSIHLAYSRCGDYFTALNGNYGILFARGTVAPDDTIRETGIRTPRIFRMEDGTYGIAAIAVNEMENVLLFITSDFIHFEELGLQPPEILEQYGLSGISPVSQNGMLNLPEGFLEGSILEIPDRLCDRMALYWSQLYSTEVKVPNKIVAKTAADVEAVQATIVYSDGSTAQKEVLWEVEGVNFQSPGTHLVRGTVQKESYRFPLASGYGDPVIFPWEGRYYFIATNDNLNDVGLYVREAEDVAGLFINGVKEYLILGLDEERGFVQTFWAPEFHVIGGELYLLFAVSGTKWGPQCHLMKLKKGGRIVDCNSWEQPIRVKRKDKNPLTEDGITLDMTYLKAKEQSYMVWSYRRNIGTKKDTGSMLYIAAVDEEAPWVLTSEPVLLSRPLYGWENVNHTINNEGPYAFTANGKIYLTYSGGAADSYTYAVGLLWAEEGADLLNPDVWNKRSTPVLSHYSVNGEYGPGHNSFFTDSRGNLMIAYHAEDALDHHIRCDGIRRVHFNIEGEPVFDLSAERDLDDKLTQVELEVIVG